MEKVGTGAGYYAFVKLRLPNGGLNLLLRQQDLSEPLSENLFGTPRPACYRCWDIHDRSYADRSTLEATTTFWE